MSIRAYDKFNVIIIVEAAGKTLGIIVDQVRDVLSIDKDSVQPPIDFEGNIDNVYVEGMAKVGERLVVVVDIDKMLSNWILKTDSICWNYINIFKMFCQDIVM